MLSDHSNCTTCKYIFLFYIFLYFFLTFRFIGALYFPCPQSLRKNNTEKKQRNPVLAVVITVLVYLW